MKPIHLFSKLSAAQGENLLTEGLTLALQLSRQFQVRFLKKAGVRIHAEEDIEFASQGRDESSGKIPDLTIASRGTDRFFLLFEIKKEYKLSRKQWSHYAKIVQSRPHRIKGTFAIVTPFTDVRELPGKGTDPRIWKWTDVYTIIEASLLKETDKIAEFLLREMLALLESKKMKPFKALSSKELSSLLHFSKSTQTVSNLLNTCFYNLQKSSGWEITPYPSGNFRWTSSNDVNWFDKIWGGVSKYVTRNKVRLGVWVGCSCDSDGTSFILSVWDEMRFPKKAFERAALKAKFEKDKDEREFDLYTLRLSMAPDSSSILPRKLADEVRSALNGVFLGLASHNSQKQRGRK